MKRIKIMLVDDSPVFAVSATQFLRSEPGLEVLGVASSGPEALGRVANEQPHVVLMDLHMPAMDGLETTRRLKAQAGAPRVIVISLDDSSENRSAALGAGADAFLGKSRFALEIPAMLGTLAQMDDKK
jgi:two-component system nitrate/nitrite response regulator NarL